MVEEKNNDDGDMVDYIDELHSLFQTRRPHSVSVRYSYSTSEMLHLHFRSNGCRYSKCICCDYGCSQKPASKEEIDFVLDAELGKASKPPHALLLGSLGSILDSNEFSRDLLVYLLHRVSNLGMDNVLIRASWWSITPDSVKLVMDSLPHTRVTFECGLESSNEAVRDICYGKHVSSECISGAVSAIRAADARICANIMLGAPFLSIEERMQDARDSILWALEERDFDEAVLFPVNIRPYTALRALYELALYEPTRLWEVITVLKQLPVHTLGRTHVAWWGNRTTEYSLGSIAPLGCDVCTDDLLQALEAYARASHICQDETVQQRNAILAHLDNSNACYCSCRHPFVECQIPSKEKLADRRAAACKSAVHGGNARLVWVSPRESDLNVASNMFVGSSTVYGNNVNGNRSYSSKTGWRENHNDVTPQQIASMASDQIDFARADDRVRFMSYNPYYTHGGNPLVLNRSICLNDVSVLNMFADKRLFRRFARRVVNVPDFYIMSRIECTTQRLDELFPNGSVVQRGISSGGEGTFVVPPHSELPDALDDPNEELLISRHHAQNIPVNVHAVIFDRAVVVFPASTQLIEARDGKLLYCGCDFESFGDLSAKAQADLYRQVRMLCAEIQKTGYRGVLGLDAMLSNGEFLFLEMNARFQASSHALNHALREVGLPTLQQLHREAFLRRQPSVDVARLEAVRVHYSAFAYSSHGSRDLDVPFEHLLGAAQANEDVVVFEDGFDVNQPRRPGAYMFGILVRGRISSIFFDRHLNVDQNVSCWGEISPIAHLDDEDAWIRLKIALLNQGCVVSDKATALMASIGVVREGVNDAIDLDLCGHVVNVPRNMPHQCLSPFVLDASEDGTLLLLAYGKRVASVTVSYRDQVQGIRTPSGVPVDRICFLATDRVRVQHHDCCDVIERGHRCKFCNFPAGRAGFGQRDIDFAINTYLESDVSFRHFLIGGGSDLSKDALRHTLEVVESIRLRCDKPIYLMDMPPLSHGALNQLKEAGVTEVAFNIEVFDRAIAKEVMPLKGALALEHYLHSLEAAVDIWGRGGEVRSALVVGIEPLSSTLKGVEVLASRGVAPILSVFRPVDGSCMSTSIGPDNTWLYTLYRKASAICASYGLELGPQCRECRNNVLAP